MIATGRGAKKKKILFLVTEDWYFVSHRLHIALALIEEGYEVLLAARFHGHRGMIEASGIRTIPVDIRRESRNILHELKTILELVRIYLREKPDITHHVATKPILYGSMAAIATCQPAYINAFAGLGFVFMASEKPVKKVVRGLFVAAYRSLFVSKAAHAIFQNPDDKALFEKLRIVKKRKAVLIKGAGVDTRQFACVKEPEGLVTIVLGARMLWDKGIGELAEAAAILNSKQVPCRILLAGIPDPANPQSISQDTLINWQKQGILEWIGFQKNMADILTHAHIAVLPSYREGVPKFLLEAAGCGRPIVATDAAGCRDVVKHGFNGILVPPRNGAALAEALEILVNDPGLRTKMGRRSRQMVMAEFSNAIVQKATMTLYEKVLKPNRN